MNPFWMVVADLRKSLLSSLGILVLLAMAFSATITVSLFERSLRKGSSTSAQEFDLVVGAPGSRLDLVLSSVFLKTDEMLPLLGPETVARLEADPRVAALSPLIFADSHWGYPIVGVGPEFPRIRTSLTLASGRWPSAPLEAVAGAGTNSPLDDHFEGAHGTGEGAEAGEHHPGTYTVVGVLNESGTPWDRAYLTPPETVWQIHEAEREHENPGDRALDADDPSEAIHGQVSAVLVKPKDFASAYALRAEYRTGSTTAAFPGEILANLFGIFDDVKTALTLFAMVFQGLVFAAALLSLLATLPSKARWIGLLRALGAGPVYVFFTLWIQSALLFAVAGLVGAAVGWGAAEALTRFVTARTGLVLPLVWTWSETWVVAAFWLVGLVGALVPALGGYRVSVRKILVGNS